MSRKTLLMIAAGAELFFGAYFMLAFMAWGARVFIFSQKENHASVMVVVMAILTATCFSLYPVTLRKIRELESK
jgi:hypothetical protein